MTLSGRRSISTGEAVALVLIPHWPSPLGRRARLSTLAERQPDADADADADADEENDRPRMAAHG
jgi:hypothetical protein